MDFIIGLVIGAVVTTCFPDEIQQLRDWIWIKATNFFNKKDS